MPESKPAVAALDSLDAPPEVRSAVARLRDDLLREAGANLAGLILYGGMARGRYRPGKSDINVVVLLNDTSAGALRRIAPILRAAWRAFRVEPLIIAPAEVARLSVAFPTKVLDISRCHIVLAGEDPFANINVPRDQIKLRIAQSLRNTELRLRRRYVAIFDDPGSLAATLAETAASLKVELAALLQLGGYGEPEGSTTTSVLEAAAAAFGLDRSTLARIAVLRRPAEQQSGLDADSLEDLAVLYGRALAVIDTAATIVSSME